MLLLVAAAIIALPNTRVLEGVHTAWSDIWTSGADDTALTVAVDQLGVERGRVRGRVRNTAGVALGHVTVRVRISASSGDRIEEASVYGLAPDAEAWFGLPLLVDDPSLRVEFVEARVRAASGGAELPAQALPGTSRRSGIGRAEEMQRFEREMEQMNEAIQSVSPEQ